MNFKERMRLGKERREKERKEKEAFRGIVKKRATAVSRRAYEEEYIKVQEQKAREKAKGGSNWDSAKRIILEKMLMPKESTRRAPTRRTYARRAPARRTYARRAPARRTYARRAPVRRTYARRAPARRTYARRAPARRINEQQAPLELGGLV